MEILQEKEKKLELLKAKEKFEQSLPHLYGFPLYKWAKDFIESTNKMNLISASNQVSKSSTQIRKCILWATDQSLWPKLWRTRPWQFWYMYPSGPIAEVEFETKWKTEFLPRDEMKNHPVYGWEAHNKNGVVQNITFNSGVNVYFKSYSQDASDLQASSVHAMFCDEEIPSSLVQELQARLIATNGHFHAVFTPTLGQEYWRQAIEETGKNRRFKDSFRQQISMYDCLKYADGSPTMWSEEKINLIKQGCKSEAEIQRRVYGRFVLDEGLKYPSFSRQNNVIERIPIPKDYRVFIGVDAGSGGDNHPTAITFIAVSPNFDRGYIFAGRRFDGMTTTNSDIVQLVDNMCAEYNVIPDAIYYDYAAVDLGTIAARMGKNYIPAEKSHAIGEQVLNVLFKNKMLYGFQDDELESLYLELTSLKQDTAKRNAVDDFIDSCRYASSKVPWDWSTINALPLEEQKIKTEIDYRRGKFFDYEEERIDISDDIDELNELYGS